METKRGSFAKEGLGGYGNPNGEKDSPIVIMTHDEQLQPLFWTGSDWDFEQPNAMSFSTYDEADVEMEKAQQMRPNIDAVVQVMEIEEGRRGSLKTKRGSFVKEGQNQKEYVPVVLLHRMEVAQTGGLTEEEGEALSDEAMEQIASKLGDALMDAGYWEILKELLESRPELIGKGEIT